MSLIVILLAAIFAAVHVEEASAASLRYQRHQLDALLAPVGDTILSLRHEDEDDSEEPFFGHHSDEDSSEKWDDWKDWKDKFGKKDDKKTKDEFECPHRYGEFPDPKDCTKYYKCSNNKPSHKDCNKNKLFDKYKKKCEDKHKATCDTDDKKDSSSEEEEDKFKCPYKYGAFAHPKDCSKFYLCLNKRHSIKTCKKGELFDTHHHNECRDKKKVDCGSRFNPYEDITTTAAPKTTRQPVTKEPTRKPTTPKEEITTTRLPEKTTRRDDEVTTIQPVTEDDVTTTGEKDSSSSEPPVVTGDEGTTIREETTPGEEGTTAAEEDTTTAEEEVTSTAEEVTTAEEEVTTTAEEVTTAEEEVTTTAEEVTTAEEEVTTTAEEVTTAEEEVTTTAEEVTTAEEEVTTTAEEVTTAVEEETTTVAEETTTEAATTEEEDKESFVCPSEKGNFHHERYCSFYYTCKKSVAKLKECPEGTLFSDEYHFCYDETEVDCGNRLRPGGATTTAPSTTSTVDECLPDDPSCMVDKEGRVLRCPEPSGLFPYPNDKSKFIQCDNYQIFIHDCPTDLTFDAQKKVCMWQKQIAE